LAGRILFRRLGARVLSPNFIDTRKPARVEVKFGATRAMSPTYDPAHD
jgi:hypothetical protein